MMQRHTGASMIELLLALPAVLLLALAIVQLTLVYHAKHALDHGLTQAARQGTLDHSSPAAIRQGLAAGLVPYLYGAGDWAGLLAAEARADDHIEQGATAGWIRLRQRSPTLESFADWAEPALDPMGKPIAGLVEIPNDNLDSRRTRALPVSGTAGLRQGEPIGHASGQTLADANLLRLELVYGVRLSVPLVGRLIVHTLSLWNGCGPGSPAALPSPSDNRPAAVTGAAPGVKRLGLVLLGPVEPLSAMQPWQCAFYEARDAQGKADGRIPIRLSSTVRMMSTARHSDATRPRDDSPSGHPSLGAGQSDRATDVALPGQRDEGPSDNRPLAVVTAPPTQPNLSNGFLRIGSDRRYPLPGIHPALCPG